MTEENEFEYQRRYVGSKTVEPLENASKLKKAWFRTKRLFQNALYEGRKETLEQWFHIKEIDKTIFFVMCILLAISLVMSYSSTMYLIEERHLDPGGYLWRQFVAVILGIVGYFLTLLVPRSWLKSPVLIILGNVFIIALLIYTALFGRIAGGAQSWISVFGFNIQPGEMAKIWAVFSASLYISHNKQLFYKGIIVNQQKLFGRFTWRPILLVGLWFLQILLISVQPDFGMVVLMLISFYLTWITSRHTKKQFMIQIAGWTGVAAIAYWWVHMNSEQLVETDNYQLARLGSFVDPFRFADGRGFQLVRAYIAMSRGDWFGNGIGNSLTKKEALPAGHTDYILAVIGEEAGFFGMVFILLCLLVLLATILYWAARSRDIYRKAFFTGVSFTLFLQMAVNIGGVLGLLPLTGVTLPLVSYGGSSILMTILLLGAVQSMIIAEKIEEQQLSLRNEVEQ